MRPAAARYILMFAIMIFPSFVLFSKGGFAYAIPFVLLTLLYMNLNDFGRTVTNNYKKILTSIPLVALFFWMVYPNTAKPSDPKSIDLYETRIAVLLSCVTIFVATTSVLLTLKRTKGEKTHD
jgi:energy-coupling factor transporter transmembrane protein EcfT